jgi:hypothetical protein
MPHLLLVDDDDLFRESLGLNLVDQGYEVTSFDNGREALAYLNGGSADKSASGALCRRNGMADGPRSPGQPQCTVAPTLPAMRIPAATSHFGKVVRSRNAEERAVIPRLLRLYFDRSTAVLTATIRRKPARLSHRWGAGH